MGSKKKGPESWGKDQWVESHRAHPFVPPLKIVGALFTPANMMLMGAQRSLL